MKQRFLLLLLIPVASILTNYSIAQTFDWTLYSQGTNAPGQNVTGWGIDKDGQGNRYVAGHFSHPIVVEGDTLFSVGGSGDIFAAKYDTSGVLKWIVQAGGLYHDFGLDIAVDNNGNSYVTGTYQGTAYFDTDSIPGVIGINQVFIAKYNSGGVFQWVARASSQGVDMTAAGITVNGSGQVFITGDFRQWAYFYSAGAVVAFDTLQSESQIQNDIYTVCYNSGGVVQWVKSGGPGGNENLAKAITSDEAGNCYITGEFYETISFEDRMLTSEGSKDICIVKYHPSGSITWATSFGTPDYDQVTGISVDVSENIYLTGFADSLVLGQDTLTGAGGTGGGPFLAKFDPGGIPIWAREPIRIDIASVRFEGVNVVPSGECYVTGYMSWPGVIFGSDTLSAITGGDNMIVARYSSDGEVAWANNAGGSAGNIIGYDVSAGENNSAYVTGVYGYDGFFGEDTIQVGPGYFVTKLKTDGTVDVEPPPSVASRFTLEQNYPNPFNPSTTIQYELKTTVDVEIVIYNMLGQKVKTLINVQQSAGNYKAIWNGENNFGEPVASGVYFYRLTMKSLTGSENNFSQTKKMLLLR